MIQGVRIKGRVRKWGRPSLKKIAARPFLPTKIIARP